MTTPIVVAEGLTKRFARRDAVTDMSFSLVPGRVLGLLGPNGSGKSTTLKMLLGLMRPTSGTALIEGTPYARLRHPARIVGAALENTAFSPARSGRDHLRMLAPYAGASHAEVDAALETVGISDDAHRAVKQYSLGMRQRLALAAALLGRPRVLVLDEPANGLDPIGITWLRQTLSALAQSGVAVLVSSHHLAEVDRVVQDVVLMHRARTVFAGTREDLLRGASVLTLSPGEREDAVRNLLRERFDLRPLPDGRFWVGERAEVLEGVLRTRGIDRGEASVTAADLESAFMVQTATTTAVAQ